MAKITFIRHGIKEYNNNRGPSNCFQHDPDIYDFDKQIALDLYEKNNFKQIICSPYKRTRNTAMKIKDYLKEKNINVDIIIEPLISEYLGNQRPKGKFADVEKETFSYFKPKLGVENINDLRRRLKRFKNKLPKINTDLLVVTHGLNISILYELFHKSFIKSAKELEGFMLKIEN